MTDLSIRVATRDDVPLLAPLIEAAIVDLQRDFLDEAQIRSSLAIMGLDTQLIDDKTYFVVLAGDDIAGCGGWSRRATLYGGDHSGGRDAALLDPARDAARVRAMYTNPSYARRGVGRLVLAHCEEAAGAEGFTALELMATLAGQPLYESVGFHEVERIADERGGAAVPLIKMRKELTASPE